MAHLHQSRGEWSQARDFLNEGLAVCEQHGITLVRPHLLVNLAIACFLVGDLDEAERVGLQTLDEARVAGNRNVEATALLHLVRVGVKRGDTAAARARLDGALVLADAMGNVSMQLDAVFCFGEIVAAEGDRHRAAALMRYYIAQAEVEPGDRAVAQAALESLPAGSAGASMIEVPLVALLQELRATLAAGAAAPKLQP